MYDGNNGNCFALQSQKYQNVQLVQNTVSKLFAEK